MASLNMENNFIIQNDQGKSYTNQYICTAHVIIQDDQGKSYTNHYIRTAHAIKPAKHITEFNQPVNFSRNF
jgi:hypothetical protein